MKETVYIETTIPSYYYNSRSDELLKALSQLTREWWDNRRQDFNVVTSAPVLDELSGGDHPLKSEKLTLMNGISLLPVTREVIDLATIYIARKGMPSDPKGDALHLALASLYKCDILLSWNCRHIVNHEKTKHLGKINAELNLAMPALLTPMELLNRKPDER